MRLSRSARESSPWASLQSWARMGLAAGCMQLTWTYLKRESNLMIKAGVWAQ